MHTRNRNATALYYSLGVADIFPLAVCLYFFLSGKAAVVHISVPPLVLSLLADSEANVGLMLDAIPQLSAAVEPLRSAAEGSNLRSTYSGVPVQ